MSLAEELGLKEGTFADPGEEALLGVLRTSEILSRIGDRTVARGDVSQSQFNILKILNLSNGEGMSQKEILAKLISTKGNLSIHIANLAERGMVSRKTSDDDGRRHVIRLTAKGRRALETTETYYKERIAEISRNMTAEEFRSLIKLMDKLRERCSDILSASENSNGGSSHE